MKKILITVLLLILPLFALFPRDIYFLETGDLLYVQPSEPCVIYLDGIELGAAPLLITGISGNSRIVQLRGESRYAEVKILYNPGKTGVSIYKPVLGEYYGLLAFDCNTDDPLVSIDGEAFDLKDRWLIKLPTGKHSVCIKKNGFLPVSEEIFVPRLEIVELSVCLISSDSIIGN